MRKQFFYQYSPEIKAIFNKYNIKNSYIAFNQNIPAIYLDHGQDNEQGLLAVIHVEKELNALALTNNQIFNGNVIPIQDPKDAYEDNALRFDTFLSDGLRGQTVLGNINIVKVLLAEGADINYQHIANQQTALHAGLHKLVKLKEIMNENDVEVDQSDLDEFRNVQATVKYLLQQNINIPIKDLHNKTAAELFIEALNNTTYFAKQTEHAGVDTLITEVIDMLKAKGAAIFPMKTKEVLEQSTASQSEKALENQTEQKDVITTSMQQFGSPLFAEKKTYSNTQLPSPAIARVHKEVNEFVDRAIENIHREYNCDEELVYQEIYRFISLKINQRQEAKVREDQNQQSSSANQPGSPKPSKVC